MSDAYHGRRRHKPDSHLIKRMIRGVVRGWKPFAVLLVAIGSTFVGVHLGTWVAVVATAPAATPTTMGPVRLPHLPTLTTPSGIPDSTTSPSDPAESSTPAATTPPGTAPPGPAAQQQQQQPPTPAAAPRVLMLDNFDNATQWSNGRNDLNGATDAQVFSNGGGRGVVSGGVLTLVYRDDGWFGSWVDRDVSAYQYLVLRVKGAAGGEQHHFKLSFGGVERFFRDLRLDTEIGPMITQSYQDIRIPMARNGMNTVTPGELQLSFWWGGDSSVVIDEIRFE